jgi:hypothetical protein
MTDPKNQLPEHLKERVRALLLAQMGNDTLDVFEIELFEWYVRNTEAVLTEMLSGEHEYIQEQVAAQVEDINDSGILAVEYYTKRLRYSHVIYLTSLLETCLERACSKLTSAVGSENIPFSVNELTGDQWSKRRKFLERYGHFELPKDIWSEVKVLISVRNDLVHQNGSTSNLTEEQRNALKKQPGIDVTGYEFKIDEAYVAHAFRAVKLFVGAVEEQVGQAIRRSQNAQMDK